MTNIDWVGFCIASVAVVLAPGPGSMFVARSAAASGTRSGLMAMLGIMVGDACLILLSLLGVSALFMVYPSFFHVIRLAGAGYLIFLGVRLIFGIDKKGAGAGANAGLPFRQAVAITLLNPKAVIFFMAFFPVFIRSGGEQLLVPYALMTPAFMVISAAYLLFLVHTASRLALEFRRNQRLQSIAQKLCGCVFVAFGLKALVG